MTGRLTALDHELLGLARKISETDDGYALLEMLAEAKRDELIIVRRFGRPAATRESAWIRLPERRLPDLVDQGTGEVFESDTSAPDHEDARPRRSA